LGDLTPVHQYSILIFLCLAIVAGILIGAISQGALFSGALEKQTVGFVQLFKKGYCFFGRVLGLDILAKLALAGLFLITVAPVAFLNPLPYSWYKYPPVISLVVFLIGAIFITAIQMLALSGVVRKHLNVRGALAEAWDIFRFHILTTIEIGVLLFLSSVVAALILLVSLLVAAIPLTFLFVLATFLTAPIFYVLAIFISFAVVIALMLLISGWLTAFQYTVWSMYFEEADRFGVVSKIRKWLRF